MILRPLAFALLALLLAAPRAARAAPVPSPAAIAAEAARAMAATGAKGLAIAVVDGGRAVSAQAFGARNLAGDPLTPDTVMYGASLTKAVFADLVLQLVDEGRLDLDAPIATYLPQPLPSYDDADTAKRFAAWGDLAGDDRWRKLTARILLNHGSGFANFPALEPDGKLHIHFEPGARYAYSNSGITLLQFVLERGLGVDVAGEVQRRVFDPFGMTDSALTWRADFEGRAASGWGLDGKAVGHAPRSKVRMAGSMDTTIADMGRFAAALVRGDRLSAKARAELDRPQLAITTAGQFPTLQPELPPAQRRRDLAAGSGVITFDGPQGRGFMKGGHDDVTGNTMVCLERGRRCVVVLANDVRAEAAFPALVRFVLGDTGAPYAWEYAGMTFWTPPALR